LNITWYDALNDPTQPQAEVDITRFLASQAIMLSLAGVPGIYIHSLLGTRNCHDCLLRTGRSRSINREKFLLSKLELELSDQHKLKSRILMGYRHLLHVRKMQPAFHPAAEQKVLRTSSDVFAIIRKTSEIERLLCITNVTARFLMLEVNLSEHGLPTDSDWVDQLKGKHYSAGDKLIIELAPYQCIWLKLVS
jgi:sucrose phosphorylase